jgi:hypothetical protein
MTKRQDETIKELIKHAEKRGEKYKVWKCGAVSFGNMAEYEICPHCGAKEVKS